jgi:photosystem II reaction center protein Psb28
MDLSIQIIINEDLKNFQKELVSIHLTNSKDKKTSTATFLFVKPNIFDSKIFLLNEISTITLIYKNKKIVSNKLNFFFKEGKPFALQGIFIFTNKITYFLFLNFLKSYMRENNSFFLKKS